MEKADEEPIVTALDQMIEAEDLILDEEAIYLPPFYYSEVGVANKIKRLLEERHSNLNTGTWGTNLFGLISLFNSFYLLQ
jgi:hypothetical protein